MDFSPEWKDRIKLWLNALTQDFYTPLGEIGFEFFPSFCRLSPEEALKGPFKPVREGFMWGREWEYGWFKSKIILPANARGIIVLSLDTGGESTIFANGKAFGTRRAESVSYEHHRIQDNFLTESAQENDEFEILVETYAGHYF
ncbi:MAG: hypothetical protein LBU32_06110 [Clostridiales bacterium]|nr:hypothetical protein [Clostridiales bacterium]